jgi:antitoxin component of MazEF toxin-antitoxin module
MNKYTATVIKTGNSIALRVPKQYADEAHLAPGDKVTLPLPTKTKQQDHAKIIRLIGKVQSLHAYGTITDPAAWQRDQRADRPLPGE